MHYCHLRKPDPFHNGPTPRLQPNKSSPPEARPNPSKNEKLIMSSDSLALFRKSLGPDLAALAEQHMKHE